MLRFDIFSLPNADWLARAISTQAGQLRSMRPVVEQAVREVVIPRIEENFRNEQEADGTQWAPLAEVTHFLPERDGWGGPILDVTGRLRRAATSVSNWRFVSEGAYMSNTALPIYAATQQFGSSISSGLGSPLTGGDIPARPYMGINDQDLNDIGDIFAEWVRERLALTVGVGAARTTVGALVARRISR